MSTIFWEISKRNIRIHMLRSTLAMLGIIIGVVAIASMGILGNSVVQVVSASLSSVGDSVIVTPYHRWRRYGHGRRWRWRVSADLKLTDQNYQQIKRAVAPNVAIPVHSTSEHMKVGVGSDDIVAMIYGLPTDQTKNLLPDLESGDYNNGNSGCLVGSTFAKDHNLKVGSRISIGKDGEYGALRVTGIIKERGMSFDISTDNAIVATKDWFENTYNDQNEYNEVVVKVTSGDTASVKTTIEKQLNRNTKEKTVSVIDSKATLHPSTRRLARSRPLLRPLAGSRSLSPVSPSSIS